MRNLVLRILNPIPDACVLATWLRKGAPLGFSEDIKSTGAFPRTRVGKPTPQMPRRMVKLFLDLNKLIQEANDQGLCTFYDTLQQVEKDLSVRPVLNKLGVIVKVKESGVRKAMGPSGEQDKLPMPTRRESHTTTPPGCHR